MRPTFRGLRVILRLFLLFLCIVHADLSSADNWPQWRGPQHDGASRETNLPLAWSESRGIAFKCPLPGWGRSTASGRSAAC